MNLEEEALMELRTIKTLLAIDKEEHLEDITGDLSSIQDHIIGLLDPYEWRPLATSEISDEFDASNSTIRNHRSELEDKNLIEKKGEGSGAKYRITGLLGCAELLGTIKLE